MSGTITGAGLVATLGWSIEDFESACRRSSREALERARDILSEDDPHEPQWVRARAIYGVKFINDLLEKDT